MIGGWFSLDLTLLCNIFPVQGFAHIRTVVFLVYLDPCLSEREIASFTAFHQPLLSVSYKVIPLSFKVKWSDNYLWKRRYVMQQRLFVCESFEAPVQLFQCPSCKQFALTSTDPLNNDYVALGDVVCSRECYEDTYDLMRETQNEIPFYTKPP